LQRNFLLESSLDYPFFKVKEIKSFAMPGILNGAHKSFDRLLRTESRK